MFQNRISDVVHVAKYSVSSTHKAAVRDTLVSNEWSGTVGGTAVKNGYAVSFLLDTSLSVGSNVAVTFDLIFRVASFKSFIGGVRTNVSSSVPFYVDLSVDSCALAYDTSIVEVKAGDSGFVNYRLKGTALVPVLEQGAKDLNQYVSIGLFTSDATAADYRVFGTVRAYFKEEAFFQPSK